MLMLCHQLDDSLKWLVVKSFTLIASQLKMKVSSSASAFGKSVVSHRQLYWGQRIEVGEAVLWQVQGIFMPGAKGIYGRCKRHYGRSM